MKTNRRGWQIQTRIPITDEHCIILPVVIVDLIFLECGRQNFPSWIIQADFEALEVVRTLLSRRSRGSTRHGIDVGIE